MFEPDQLAMYEAYQDKILELDMANEIYLAKNCSAIHYADIMNHIPDGLVSKASVVNWLNDYVRNGVMSRPGVLSMYQIEVKEHFRDGNWSARFFVKLIDFAFMKFMDVEYIGNRKKVEEFKRSIQNDEWRKKVEFVIGLKMLEKLFLQERLLTDTAKSIIGLNYQNRILLEKIGSISGRTAKNQGLNRTDSDVIQAEFERHWKRVWEIERQRFAQSNEEFIYRKHLPKIETSLYVIKEKLMLGDGQ
jgi:hypothetical protein